MIALVTEKIEIAPLIEQAQTPASGAVLSFVGVTREMTGDRQTESLRYEAYVEMARAQLEELEALARKCWPLQDCIVVHRLGTVPLGEASVAIVVASAHRQASFEAGQWLIDSLKRKVPIWKEEHWSDGTSAWVHPKVEPSPPQA